MAAIAVAAALYSCDDSTTGIGGFVSDIDRIDAYAEKYDVTSKTHYLGKVYSRTNKAYLGKYTDPDFGDYTASFITEVYCPEGFKFPEHNLKITGASLELYYTNYYGDSLATMTVAVDKLSRPINDDDTELYYTSYNPENFYDKNAEPLAKRTYAAIDYSVSDSIRNLDSYYPSVNIDLGNDFAQYIKDKYDENHDNFKDAHSFINNVLPGFYVHTTQGNGSVIYIQDIWLRINMEYDTKRPSTGVIDSTVVAYSVFAASKEVLMSTRMENDEKLKEMADEENSSYNKATYLKTPAGLCTEVELPINEIYKKHSNDTLNSVTMSIKKYRYLNDENVDKSSYKMGIPQNILLIRKSEEESFFLQNKTYDNKTSFLGTYNSSTNSYTFSKLNRLISHIFSEIRDGNDDADRDKVLLIPVTTETDSEGNVIGVSHDMEVNAARLFGGAEGEKLSIEVTYTQP